MHIKFFIKKLFILLFTVTSRLFTRIVSTKMRKDTRGTKYTCYNGYFLILQAKCEIFQRLLCKASLTEKNLNQKKNVKLKLMISLLKKQLRLVLSVSSIFIKYYCYFLLESFIRFLF